MKKLILLSSMLFMLCGSSIFAQETITTSEVSKIDRSSNNLTIFLNIDNYVDEIQSKILDSNVNAKEGFNAEVDFSNKQVVVVLSKEYPEDDLILIFQYLGIELTETTLGKIRNGFGG